MKHNFFQLLDNIQEEDSPIVEGERILIIDSLNLFFRNFSVLNMVNSNGAHIGGLGGFLRSLGVLIREIQPTSVYMVFDGAGSSNNRKNIIPEYKSGRHVQRITNWDVFENLGEEQDSKIDQIVRVIQYLKTLPVKILSLDKVEADDIIAYLSSQLSVNKKNKVFIVSQDMDFLQLVTENVTVYRPTKKEYYTEEVIRNTYGIEAYNFIIYKTLLGDNSDKVKGIKGMGGKTLLKRFPELTQSKLTLEDVYNISVNNLKKHVMYPLIINNMDNLEKNYLVMDLSTPLIDENDKIYINNSISSQNTNYSPSEFRMMYDEDQLGGIIKDVNSWLKNNFEKLK